VSLLSGPYYRRVLKDGRGVEVVKNDKKSKRRLTCANKLSMNVDEEITAIIKLDGVQWPATFLVVEQLVHDVIIGMDLLRVTQAAIDTETSTLTLFGGITAVPMTTAGEQLIVRTTDSFKIPPYSEAVISVSCSHKPTPDNYVIENDIRSPCQKLLIGRTLVDVSRDILPCRVMNPTAKEILLKAQTPVGVLAAVELTEQKTVPKAETKTNAARKELTTAEKRAALEEKSISFKETVLEGTDFVDLINLLYDNIDLFATSLEDLPGCDLLMHRIETGNNPPVNQRSYRLAPDEKAEVTRQIDEMLRADIITETDSPYNSPLILVKKKPDAHTGLPVPPPTVH
jgi:hypothetical protein